jgi:hypothetical protein
MNICQNGGQCVFIADGKGKHYIHKLNLFLTNKLASIKLHVFARQHSLVNIANYLFMLSAKVQSMLNAIVIMYQLFF